MHLFRLLSASLIVTCIPLHASDAQGSSARESGALRRSGFDGDIDKVVLPLERTPSGMIVHVEINGHAVRLLVDTGASSTHIFLQCAARIGLKADIPTNSVTAAGIVKQGKRGVVSQIRLGEAWTMLEPIKVMDVPKDLVDNVDGVLGLATLWDWDVRIDVPGRTMTLYREGKLPPLPGETCVPMIIQKFTEASGDNPQRFHNRSIYTSIEIDGKTVPMMLDSGYGGSFQLPLTLARAIKPNLPAKSISSVPTTVTLSGVINEENSKFSEIRFGSDTLKSVNVSITTFSKESESNAYGIIGLNVLRHYVMSFRFSAGELRLKPIGTLNELTSASTAGIYFTPDYKILGLLPHGPAEKAGLRTGDQVIAIDGHLVVSLTVDQLETLKLRPPGTPCSIRYSRGGATPQQVVLLLEKQ